MRTLFWIAALMAACAMAQTRESFEVATIKPFAGVTVGVQIAPGGRLSIQGITLRGLAAAAYGLSPNDVRTSEAWMEKDQFSVEAKPADDAGITDLRHGYWDVASPRLREMLQSLLAERFQLRVRRETKPGDVYRLIQSGKTLRLKPSEVQTPTGEGGDGRSNIGRAGRWVIASTTMPQLAAFAGAYIVKAPVEDATGLSGAFDYPQPRENAAPQETDLADSFRYFMDEIGLKLEKTRGTIESLVIESAQKPSDN